jgi:hypothetical protein
VNSVNLSIKLAIDDGSEVQIASIDLKKKGGVFSVQDVEVSFDAVTHFVGASVVENGNMHISVMEGPLMGLTCHLYQLIVVDVMACLRPNVPAQVIGRLRNGKLVRVFVEGK